MASAKYKLTLLPPIVRIAIVTGLVAVGVCTVHSPTVLAVPAADHVSGDCDLSAASIAGLVTDMGAGSGSAFAAPQVDFIVVYTRDNPNHGQLLAAGTPPSYTGPIVCGNGTVPTADLVTSLETDPLNAAVGTSDKPVTVTATEQSTVLQHVPTGATTLDNAQNRFCHTAGNNNDCFRITGLPAPVTVTPPSAPSSGRTYGGCLLNDTTVDSLKADMSAGGIPIETSKVDYLVVYTRANPNDGQLLSGLSPSYSGPVLCSNPDTVAIDQVLDNTLVPASVDLKGLNHATYLQYIASGEGANTEKKICHSALPNVDCFLVKAATPPPPPVKVYSSAQNFNTAGVGLGYTPSIGYGSTPASVISAADSFLRLTNAQGGLLNMIAFDQMNEGAFSKFVVDFDFRMDADGLSSIPRADGIGFAFLNTAANQSTSGASPVPVYEDTNRTMPIGTPSGYAKSSLQIGFDTYNNGAADRNNANHISLFYDGLEIAYVNIAQFDLANKLFNHAHIEAAPALSPQSGCNVTLKVTPSGSSEIVIFDGVNVPGMVPYNGRAVFGGRTGASWETHDIDNVAITITE